MVDYIDGENRLIYLDASTANTSIHPIDIFKEVRTMRKVDENLQKYLSFIRADGNVLKAGIKSTERYVTLLDGTRIVPYDTSHTLTLTGTIITDDGNEGIDCFNKTLLTIGSNVDINYFPPQVEVITVTTGTGGVSSTDVNIISVAGEPVASIDEFKADTSLIPNYVWSYAVRELTVNPGLTPAQEIKIDNIQTSVIAVPDAVLDKVAP